MIYKPMKEKHKKTQMMKHSPVTVGLTSDSEDVFQSSSSTTTSAPFAPPPFTAETRTKHNLPGTASVEKFFHLIYGENLFYVLAEQWNLYARQNEPGSSFNWVDTSESEMKLFMGIPLVMGVHKLTRFPRNGLSGYRNGDL